MSRKISFLALGDSYTVGEGVSYHDCWPVQLKKLFPAIETPVILAKTGWTTGELLQGLEKSSLNGPFDLVSLLIGVNNQYRGLSAGDYRNDFEVLIKKAIYLAGNRASQAMVISIPDWGATPFGSRSGRNNIGEELDLFNKINHETARHYGCSYVNITGISRQAHNHPSLLSSDELHPSGEMYKMWVKEIVLCTGAMLTR